MVWKSLQNAIQHVPKNHMLLIAGDCNTPLNAAPPAIDLVRGVFGELGDENWRFCSTTLVRGVSVELEAENWRLSNTTLVRGAICRAGS